ncbi:hypothetical protein L3X38_042065 [Prunus dulcis]|uniref:Retrotransposon gag domain-containing protein n=1 Tax=Prunus dulcis TaxID=3755 RepID=A0AAD4YKV8_PRUDU|nr:hypothetical protein L3X38_042065 [Prunus dulcis]
MIQDMVPHARRIGRAVYRRPYPEHFPRGFKVSNFALFSGDGLQSTVEHIDRFTAQGAKIEHHEALKLRTMEQIFHKQFYRPELEVSMADLAMIRQGSNESVQEYLGKFKEARARCTANMLEHEFMKLAQGGLFLDLRKKFEGIEFLDIYDFLLRVDRYEALLKEEQQKNQPTSQPTL